MDKHNLNYLRQASERLSVLNWGSGWEIRRYALIAAFLDAYQADWDFDNRFTVGGAFEALPLGDRIDVAMHVIHSGYISEAHDLLTLDVSQFGETEKSIWFELGWKTLLCDAEKLTKLDINEPTDVIFMGPIENLLSDYRKFTIRFRSAVAHGGLRFKTNSQNHSEIKLKFKSTEPSGIVMMLEALKEGGWTLSDNDASLSATQVLEFHAVGDSHTEDTTKASALAMKYVQWLSCMHTNDVSWIFDTSEINRFDVMFIEERTTEIKKVLREATELKHLKIVRIGSV